MKKQFTNEQIIYALRQAESGTQVLEVCRKMGIAEQTFYRWKKKFAGLGVAELARLRQLEDENKRLKSLVADLTLDKHMLQEVLRKSSKADAETRGHQVFVHRLSDSTAAGVSSFRFFEVNLLLSESCRPAA